MRTRRFLLYTGHLCDRQCNFCVDKAMPDESYRWYDFETELKPRIEGARSFYHDEWVDLTGGEPSLHPDISGIIRHCRKNDLRVRMITHGGHLKERGLTFLVNGVEDFAISIHGSAEANDRIMGHKGATAAAHAGIEEMKQEGGLFKWDGSDGVDGNAFSINCMLTKDSCPTMKEFVEDVKRLQPRQIQFLIICSSVWDRMPHYSEIVGAFERAYESLPPMPLRLRFVPLCMVPERLRRHVCNYRSFAHDTFEWDWGSWKHVTPEVAQSFIAVGKHLDVYGDTDDDILYNTLGIKHACDMGWFKPAECDGCSHEKICDGVQRPYYDMYGGTGLKALDGPELRDPCHYWNQGQMMSR